MNTQGRRINGVEYQGDNPVLLEVDRLQALNAALVEALEAALKIADSWVHDQYDGTSLLKGGLKELKPLKDILAKARQ